MKNKQKLSVPEFLTLHPRCCYCAGRRPATERDHAPARVFFRGRQSPEGFEFPSCSDCNRAVAISEQVAAFYVRSLDDGFDERDEAEFKKMIEAICNNAPNALPSKATPDFSGIGVSFETIDVASRTVTIPPVAAAHLELFAIKMLYAMFYRETGICAGTHQRRIALWAQCGTESAETLRARSAEWFEELKLGTRRNFDLGDQFQYQTGYHAAHGFFGLHMTFGRSLLFWCALGPARQLLTLKPKPPLFTSVASLGGALQKRKA